MPETQPALASSDKFAMGKRDRAPEEQSLRVEGGARFEDAPAC